ncbi:MAG: type III pantothenate kinase [Bacteroidia bacterium]|nr:type III pantothenate kinase [Bacteroidia bacterium]
MQVIVDVGNSRSKIALFHDKKWSMFSFTHSELDRKALEKIIQSHSMPSSAIIASVAEYDSQIDELLRSIAPLFKFDSSLKIPIPLNYRTPLTLGNDRLANACALFDRYTGDAAVAIDCGTCIKFDMVDASGKYLGGSISPGIKMRFSVLSEQTAQLPNLEIDSKVQLIGDSTVKSIQSGVLNGVISEIDGMIQQYESLFPGIKKVLTGGDAELLAGKLKSSIFVAPNLTMLGLKVILDHNLKLS